MNKRKTRIKKGRILALIFAMSIMVTSICGNVYATSAQNTENAAGGKEYSSEDVNPTFAIQHYLDYSSVAFVNGLGIESDGQVSVINTSNPSPTPLPTNEEEFAQQKNTWGEETGLHDNADQLHDKNGVEKNMSHVQVNYGSADKEAEGGPLTLVDHDYRRLFMDELTSYKKNPAIEYMSRLYNGEGDYNDKYTLKAVWVLKEEKRTDIDKEEIDKRVSVQEEEDPKQYQEEFQKEYQKYFYEIYNEKGYLDLNQDNIIKQQSYYDIYEVPVVEGKRDPGAIGFTNNGNNPHIKWKDSEGDPEYKIIIDSLTGKRKYPYKYTILVKPNTVIRFIYEPTKQGVNEGESGYLKKDVNFFDYDITDGHIYTDSNFSHSAATSTQANYEAANSQNITYANTSAYGVNLPDHYTGGNVEYAFGHANAGTDYGTKKWSDPEKKVNSPNTFNTLNSAISYGLH